MVDFVRVVGLRAVFKEDVNETTNAAKAVASADVRP
jgi:hypothetical protein